MPHAPRPSATRRSVLALLALAALTACFHVEHPRLTPRSVDWLGADTAGVALRVNLAAYNPNTFELPLHDLRATLTLTDHPGAATITNLAVVLPPQREVPVTVDLLVPWSAMPDAALAAVSSPVLEYRIDGTVTAERYISATAHFTQRGAVPREVLVAHAMTAVQNAQTFLRALVGGGSPPPATRAPALATPATPATP
jgi:hypothetical protein